MIVDSPIVRWLMADDVLAHRYSQTLNVRLEANFASVKRPYPTVGCELPDRNTRHLALQEAVARGLDKAMRSAWAA